MSFQGRRRREYRKPPPTLYDVASPAWLQVVVRGKAVRLAYLNRFLNPTAPTKIRDSLTDLNGDYTQTPTSHCHQV